MGALRLRIAVRMPSAGQGDVNKGTYSGTVENACLLQKPEDPHSLVPWLLALFQDALRAPSPEP